MHMEALSKDNLFLKVVEAYSRPTRIVHGKDVDADMEVLLSFGIDVSEHDLRFVEDNWESMMEAMSKDNNFPKVIEAYSCPTRIVRGKGVDADMEVLLAFGIYVSEHDIRFVKDNWESPVLGSWGLGCEFWMDGVVITPFTHFQQVVEAYSRPTRIVHGKDVDADMDVLLSFGIDVSEHDLRFVEDNCLSPHYFAVIDLTHAFRYLVHGVWAAKSGWMAWRSHNSPTSSSLQLSPISVEITYGLERILMLLQGVDHFKKIQYADGITYVELFLENLLTFYLLLLEYVCSFSLKSCVARFIAAHWRDGDAFLFHLLQRWSLEAGGIVFCISKILSNATQLVSFKVHHDPRSFVLEIGTEEMPPHDVVNPSQQLKDLMSQLLEKHRLNHGGLQTFGTPLRLVSVYPILPKLSMGLRVQEVMLQIIKEAALLAMSDLATPVVTEFTSLSGIMAHHYALIDGYSKQVFWNAILLNVPPPLSRRYISRITASAVNISSIQQHSSTQETFCSDISTSHSKTSVSDKYYFSEYWASVGCTVMQCSNTEVGAGTMNPLTYLRVLGPKAWNVA
ncbi:hypothetical protein CRYUN_Cryun01aG0206200 [Craigia yunnanensis]